MYIFETLKTYIVPCLSRRNINLSTLCLAKPNKLLLSLSKDSSFQQPMYILHPAVKLAATKATPSKYLRYAS